MIKELKKYILFLWIILLSVGGQWLAHIYIIAPSCSSLQNITLSGYNNLYIHSLQEHHSPAIICGLLGVEDSPLDSEEAEIEEDNSNDENKHSENKSSNILFSKWYFLNTVQASLFHTHVLNLFSNKLFMVFCTYII